MKKAKVYFLKDFSKLGEATKKVLQGFYPRGAKVLAKIHFGEPGNPTAFIPKDIEPVMRGLRELGVVRERLILIDTPVAYHSPRATVEGYSRVVRERGYDKLADFMISEKGKKVKMADFNPLVCKELVEAENVLVISHTYKSNTRPNIRAKVPNIN